MYREQQLKALFEGKRILIAGYGREGKSTEQTIRRLCHSAALTIADGNEQISELSSRDFDLIVKSPGVPMWVIDKAGRERVTSQTDLFMQVYADRVIGVTGTKGKSTTSSLIHHLIGDSILAGNIGIPLFDRVAEMQEERWVVAELSCHQLEVLRRSPHIAVVLNLFQEHLDHYEDYMGYKMAKMQIALHQKEEDHFFYSEANKELRELVEQLPIVSHRHPYNGACKSTETTVLDGLSLKGEHFRLDALVALRVAQLATGKDVDSFAEAMASFKGLRHRLERVGEKGGIVWYNDSISTIPEATIAALNALNNVGTLILGGFDRGIDYSSLAKYLIQHPVENIVLVGKAGERMGTLLEGIKSQILKEDDYEKIVAWCAQRTKEGAICLLSPAAASYDAFKNFEERGERFVELINRLV